MRFIILCLSTLFLTITPPSLAMAQSNNALSRLPQDVQREVGAALEAVEAGRQIQLTRTTIPFFAGLGAVMTEQCGMPRNTASRTRLAVFVATSQVGLIGGFDFSNPNLGDALGAATRQQLLFAAGAVLAQSEGCTPALDRIGTNLARSINDSSAQGSPFVASCRSTFDDRRCTCLANIARQVIPNIAQRRYSPSLMREIIERNPFIGLTIGLSCGISNY